MGDFNEVLNQMEKKGGRPVGNNQAHLFKEIIDTSGLIDLGFQEDPYTWTKNQLAEHNIMERLERRLINQAWLDLHPQMTIQHLPRIASDHAPLLLREQHIKQQRSKNFRIEHLWFLHPQMKEVVLEDWNQSYYASPPTNLLQKMDDTTNALIGWSKTTFGHLPSLINTSRT
ncbi:uncharacterized protein LOC113358952 [Papaver somniferum]|uniref:uncharacterized protein LOC113358952 n=1 Tax=Papaver somniferum TaxID=3469 RepID=UPI000E6FB1AC|nr:uncharacterized protein LOC113358952 [Papaver somniferum]